MNPDLPDGQPTAAQQVEDLIAANAASNNTMLNLVEKVQQDAELRGKKVELLQEEARQTRKQILIASVGVVLMLIIGVANAINLNEARHNAAVVAATAKDANGTYTLLLDCLNPAGVCGKQAAEQNVHTLDEIKKYELIVLYCVRINPAVADPKGEAFIACVNRLYPGGPQLQDR